MRSIVVILPSCFRNGKPCSNRCKAGIGSGSGGFPMSLGDSVIATFDMPEGKQSKKLLYIIYALPNGNTTAQTAGKIMEAGDDWHFDIQHIAAQTAFIRKKLKDRRVIVVVPGKFI